jgi:hypothetical protein
MIDEVMNFDTGAITSSGTLLRVGFIFQFQ